MRKAVSFILTPFVLLLFIVFSFILAFASIYFFMVNPVALLGVMGIAAVLLLVLLFFSLMVSTAFVFAAVYYFLRDTGKPFQESKSKKYSLEQQDEVGRKKQKSSRQKN